MGEEGVGADHDGEAAESRGKMLGWWKSMEVESLVVVIMIMVIAISMS